MFLELSYMAEFMWASNLHSKDLFETISTTILKYITLMPPSIFFISVIKCVVS